VILASGGYPAEYAKNLPIRGVEDASRDPGVVVFHAGTRVLDGSLVTHGGRVMGVTAVAADVSAARTTAYVAADKIHFDNVHRRDDIGVAP
jgi:phosphoribosylamine--glycine ligase